MGFPTPWPPDPSDDDCVLCTPALFPPGQTPAIVKMSSWGIVACPGAPHPAPNGLVALRQLPAAACIWRLITADYTFLWFHGGGCTQCMITSPPTFGSYFYHNEPPICNVFMNNKHEDCTPPDALGFGGSVMIFWP